MATYFINKWNKNKCNTRALLRWKIIWTKWYVWYMYIAENITKHTFMYNTVYKALHIYMQNQE